jgi:hypothetical protein
MSDVCGAVAEYPWEFIEINRRVLGVDYSGQTTKCIAEPHGAEVRHWGLLILDGDVKGERYWEDPPPEPAG